ncbi:phytanoyl-CoA dioxygenase family protein [Phenylobacterium sp. LjRoot225]|uniref:phytanoyl-CoA dioxygenase family protein n=1 Tax=Phenylobacterium sp. LjRoot225 TaxID=3342285 RepID=UPI003ED05303
MSAEALRLPEAEDLEVHDVTPRGELESCNHLLDDHSALIRCYEENGYILLRQVLDPASVERARDEMLAIAARHGLVAPGDKDAVWTGVPINIFEESLEFSGISRRLIEHPANLQVMEKVLGEPACAVPIVQYRLYPPNGPITRIHQDGFYSPGILDYKPVWAPLTPCQRELGGLMLAVGQNKRGYFHNLAKPSFPVPTGVVPDESWATTDYIPGDVLIVHPFTPHASRPNNSNRLRVTFDTRVQSASRPSAVAVTVKAVTPRSVTVETDAFGERTYGVDAQTFIRVLDPGVREPFHSFAQVTKPGMRLVLVTEGDRAVMLRQAAEG